MPTAYIGIGSNLGDRPSHIATAQRMLDDLPDSQVIAASEVYETPAQSPVPQGPYLNAATALSTTLSPRELHEAMQAIEYHAGRPPRDQRVRWGPRTLDLDLLLYDDQIICDDDLIVPHPHMHERWFVLKPLAEISPSLVHPLLEMTVQDLLRYTESSDQSGKDASADSCYPIGGDGVSRGHGKPKD